MLLGGRMMENNNNKSCYTRNEEILISIAIILAYISGILLGLFWS